MVSTLSWALKIVRTTRVPQNLLCEQALCFHCFAVVENLEAPPTEIANLCQNLCRLDLHPFYSGHESWKGFETNAQMYYKEKEVKRLVTVGYVVIPILLQGRMTNYWAELLIFNYVLGTLLAFFQRTNFCKVHYWFESVQRNTLPINYLFWQF